MRKRHNFEGSYIDFEVEILAILFAILPVLGT